ncbi:MAG: methionine gamma-lyase family protein [Clostridia bacterium]|nr:methionine gamma-lyase family protein [Clostridia bacterium]
MSTDRKSAVLCAERAEAALTGVFAGFDRTARVCAEKIMAAFSEFRVSDAHLHGTTGYGYDDRGRDTLEQIYARVFGCEAALVRQQITCGTHAIAIGLFGLLRPGDVLLSVTGKPYDTLDEVIGLSGEPGNGSLAEYGVKYEQINMKDGKIDLDAVSARLGRGAVKVVFVQRSKGYDADRRTLSVAEIGRLCELVHSYSGAYVVVDNCYGEFTEETEPVGAGADLQIGSLIKNPGGGLCRTGGYLAGTKKAVQLCSYRFTCPGIGAEVGASLDENRAMYQGLFFAPTVVAAALKCAALAAYMFGEAGYKTVPCWDEPRYDIIQAVDLGSAEKICAFCRGIQSGSPVDSYVTPEPWDMPGYGDKVVMAAGTFTSGASIELSADAPIRPPYTVYFQGGLTYETGRLGIISAYERVADIGEND